SVLEYRHSVMREASRRSIASRASLCTVSKYEVTSSQVYPFQVPPASSTRRVTSSLRIDRVPLKFMCSTQWEIPVIPGRSSRDPTRYQHQTETTGACRIS